MNKEYFQRTWGDGGYYEDFSYGVGIDRVCEVALYPFLDKSKHVLEIGSGGGAFTGRISHRVKHITAIDVIRKPIQFILFDDNLTYIELPDNSFDCHGVQDESIDFAFCYNLFCHLPEENIREYIQNVHRVLKPGGEFVFMLANFEHTKKHVDSASCFKRNDLLPMGHYYQDKETINYIAHREYWEFVNLNMIPEHRDLIIHLKKI
jgi:SAM-dependent methyltransferase